MRSLGNYEFPETAIEAETWKPTFRVIALHCKVLVVAKTRTEGAWKAYCTPVPGLDHDKEWKLWERDGAQISKERARPMFPEFEGLPYAR